MAHNFVLVYIQFVVLMVLYDGCFMLNFRIFLDAFMIHFLIVRSAVFALFEGHAKAALKAPNTTNNGPMILISFEAIGMSEGDRCSQ